MLLLSLFAVRLAVERPAADDGGAARRLAGISLVAAAGSGFVWFWVAVAGMNGSGLMDSLNAPLFKLVLTETTPGEVWMVRGGIGVTLGLLLCFARGGWSWMAGAVLAAAFTGSLAWLGHAGASEEARRPWMLANDVAHLVAGGVWPAGLLPFALLLCRQMKGGALTAAYAAARRFSTMSLVAVGVLAASGIVNACFLVGSFHALVATDYGRLLVLKVALFAAAVALGAWNRLVHKPRLEIVPPALEAMAWKVWIEVALGTLIVLVVAIMGTLPPGSHP